MRSAPTFRWKLVTALWGLFTFGFLFWMAVALIDAPSLWVAAASALGGALVGTLLFGAGMAIFARWMRRRSTPT